MSEKKITLGERVGRFLYGGVEIGAAISLFALAKAILPAALTLGPGAIPVAIAALSVLALTEAGLHAVIRSEGNLRRSVSPAGGHGGH